MASLFSAQSCRALGWRGVPTLSGETASPLWARASGSLVFDQREQMFDSFRWQTLSVPTLLLCPAQEGPPEV